MGSFSAQHIIRFWQQLLANAGSYPILDANLGSRYRVQYGVPPHIRSNTGYPYRVLTPILTSNMGFPPIWGLSCPNWGPHTGWNPIWGTPQLGSPIWGVPCIGPNPIWVPSSNMGYTLFRLHLMRGVSDKLCTIILMLWIPVHYIIHYPTLHLVLSVLLVIIDAITFFW